MCLTKKKMEKDFNIGHVFYQIFVRKILTSDILILYVWLKKRTSWHLYINKEMGYICNETTIHQN